MFRTNTIMRHAHRIPARVNSQLNMATEEIRLQETVTHEHALSSVYEAGSGYCYFKQFLDIVKLYFT